MKRKIERNDSFEVQTSFASMPPSPQFYSSTFQRFCKVKYWMRKKHEYNIFDSFKNGKETKEEQKSSGTKGGRNRKKEYY